MSFSNSEKVIKLLLGKEKKLLKWLGAIATIHMTLYSNLAYSEMNQNNKGERMSTSQSQQFTPVWPHGKMREIFKDVFFITGTNKITHEGKNIQTSRNMVVIRNGNELTLINTVRLDDEGLQELDRLGKVTHIARIGVFHGRDDAFYRDRYPNSLLWNLKGMTYESGLKADRVLIPGAAMPFTDCSLFVFETSKLPEGIVHIERDGGILISCDSIQNITCTDEFYNTETAESFHSGGLVKPANITHIWLGATHTKATDFQKLLKTMKFKHLVTAHGEPLRDSAFEEVSKTVKRVFPESGNCQESFLKSHLKKISDYLKRFIPRF